MLFRLMGSEGLPSEVEAAGHCAEETQVRSRSGEGLVRVVAGNEPFASTSQLGCCSFEAGSNGRQVGSDAGNCRPGLVDLVQVAADNVASVHRQFAHYEVDGLDAVCPLVDRRDAGIPPVLGGAGLLHITHATVDLDADGRQFHSQIRAPSFGDRGEQAGPA